MKRIAGIFGLAVIIVGSLGCATRNPGSLEHPHMPGRPFQAPPVTLEDCAPVRKRIGQDASISVAVAMSGGGHRAGNFGVGVFLALEHIRLQLGNRFTNVLREVDYLSSVSGGGFAIAAYIVSLHDHLLFGGSLEDYSFHRAMGAIGPDGAPISMQRNDPRILEYLRMSYHGDLIEGMFVPSAKADVDRGDDLQKAFNRYILCDAWRKTRLAEGGRGNTLSCDHGSDSALQIGCMYGSPDKGNACPIHLPYWILNATAFENGAIFAFTPDQFRRYKITGYRHDFNSVRFGGTDFRSSQYEEFLRHIPLAVALTSSCAFPVAVPPRALESAFDPMNPYLYLMDGGIADNLGVFTALQVLRNEKEARRRVLIVVDAYAGQFAPYSRDPNAPPMLRTLLQTTWMSLDSARGRLREWLDWLKSSGEFGGNLEVVYVSFDDLARLEGFEPLKRHGLREEDIESLGLNGSIDGRKVTPFLHARSIATSFSLSEENQRFLFAAAGFIVESKVDEIRRALGQEEAAPLARR